MANVITPPTFFPQRISMYVPAMQYASDVNLGNGATRVSFGAPAAATTNTILNLQSIATAGTVDVRTVAGAAIGVIFGRNLVVVASGPATGTVTVRGLDYLSQALTENFALNGATPVLGVKAFKQVFTVTFPTVAGTTISIGQGLKLGLPYKTDNVSREIANGAAAATVGTLQLPSTVDPATATSLDPRGMYTPVTVLNNLNLISATCSCYNDVNTANHGGLHGIAQFGG